VDLVRSFQTAVLALALGAAPALVLAEPPEAAVAAAPARKVAPVRLAGTLGFDVGFTELLEVEMDDGSSRSITANQGFFVSLGAAFLPLLDGKLETQATLGVKYAGIEASNGDASFIAFPLEVLEAFHADPLRLAAGIVYLHRPGASGKGVLSAFDVDFESSIGLVFEADWTWRAKPGAPLLAMGPRFVWQKLQVRGGGPVVDANAVGFVMSFTGG
jgi:hypothetical protein